MNSCEIVERLVLETEKYRKTSSTFEDLDLSPVHDCFKIEDD